MATLVTEEPASWDGLLPSELVSRIFRFAILEGLQAGSTSVRSSALLFGRVSKRWRDIAYSAPSLWTSISVNVRSDTPIPPLVSGIRAWILRAGALPLSVRLILPWAPGEVGPKQVALLTETVLSFSTQIRYFFFKQDYDPLLVGITTQEYIILGEGGFPILETLDLECPLVDSTTILTRMLTSASTIRHLSLINCNGITPVIARSMLRCAPELEACKLLFIPPTTTEPPANEGMTHHRLRRLHVGPIGFTEFLSELSLPALTHLTFDGAGLDRFRLPTLWPQSSIKTFIVRSQCALERLSFSKINLTPPDLEACIELVSPTLRVLCIDGGPYGLVRATLLARLTVRAVDQEPMNVLCPLLERVEVHGGVLEKEGYGSGMLDMLESRFYLNPTGMEGAVQLKSAYIGGTFGPLQRKRVDKLKKDGLNLQFMLEGNRFL